MIINNMLTKIDKIEILKLRSENFSYQAIHEKLGFAVDTIMKVCRNEEERKIKGVEEDQRESKKAEESQMHLGNVHFYESIEGAQGILRSMDNLVKNGNLQAKERKEWEKRTENLREIMRIDIDDKVASERSNAIKERDKEWIKHIEQNYVQNKVVTDLNNMIKAKETTIENLNNTIENNDSVLASIQQENKILHNRIRDIFWENNDLKEKNFQLQYHIENRLDADVGQWQEKLKFDREVFYIDKTNFDNYKKAQQSNLNKLFFEAEEKRKTAKMHEAKLIEQEGKLKKREIELDKNRTRMYDAVEESIQVIEKRDENVTELEKGLKIWNAEQKDELDTERKKIKDDQEKITQELRSINKTVEELKAEEHRLQEWQKLLNKTRGFNKFSLPCPHCEKPMLCDANNQERTKKISKTFGNYIHPECRLKVEQQKHVILRPVSCSGEPVLQSGFSQIIQSGGEPIVVQTSGEPVVQSGCPPVYYFGAKVFNKN